MAGDHIADTIEIVDRGCFQLYYKVELTADRGNTANLRIAGKQIEQTEGGRPLQADQQDRPDDIGVDLTNVGAIAPDNAAALEIRHTLARRAARQPDSSGQSLQSDTRFLGQDLEYLSIFDVELTHAHPPQDRTYVGPSRQYAGLIRQLT